MVEHGKVGVSTDILFGPVSPIPHALVDANGFPYKDSKSMHQNSLQMFPVVISSLPQGWIPYLKVCSSSKHIQKAVSYGTSSMSLSCRVHTKLPRSTEPWNMAYFKDSQLQLWWGCHYAWARLINLNLCCNQLYKLHVCGGKGSRDSHTNFPVCIWKMVYFTSSQPHIWWGCHNTFTYPYKLQSLLHLTQSRSHLTGSPISAIHFLFQRWHHESWIRELEWVRKKCSRSHKEQFERAKRPQFRGIDGWPCVGVVNTRIAATRMQKQDKFDVCI